MTESPQLLRDDIQRPAPTNGVATSVMRLRETEQEADQIVQRARQATRETLAQAHERASEERRQALEHARQNAAEKCKEFEESAVGQINSIDAEAQQKIDDLKQRAGRNRDRAVQVLLAEVLA